jgi:DNA-binding CsgD family transcriptional regulator
MRGILSALRGLASAPGAFVCIPGELPDTTGLGRFVDGQTSFAGFSSSLETRFGIDATALSNGRGLVAPADAVWSPLDRTRIAYWRDHSIPDGFSTALVVFLRDGPSLHGIAGVERRIDDGPFSKVEMDAIAAVEPLFAHAVAAQFHIRGLHRRTDALRAIGEVRGQVLIVDCARRCVVQASSDAWRPPSRSLERALVAAAMQWLDDAARGPRRLPLRLGDVVVHGVRRLEGGDESPSARYAAVHIASASPKDDAVSRLSPREREVAQLLVDGYSNVNIAALCGLSTNTVRTFMRRLYDKLGVFNRADLVRELVRSPNLIAPEGRVLAGTAPRRHRAQRLSPPTAGETRAPDRGDD